MRSQIETEQTRPEAPPQQLADPNVANPPQDSVHAVNSKRVSVGKLALLIHLKINLTFQKVQNSDVSIKGGGHNHSHKRAVLVGLKTCSSVQ